METVNYQLRSREKEYVKVQKDSAHTAKELVARVITDSGFLQDKAYDYLFFHDNNLKSKALDLKDTHPNTLYSRRLQDVLYLSCCAKMLEITVVGEPSPNSKQLHKNIVEAIKDLQRRSKR